MAPPPEHPRVRYALTLFPEWAWAVEHLGKDIENRPWQPAKTLAMGEWMGVHAGAFVGGSKAHSMEAMRVALDRVARRAERSDWSVVVEVGDLCYSYHYTRGDEKRTMTCRHRSQPWQPGDLPVRAIVAVARLTDVTTRSPSPWAAPGDLHWKLGEVKTLPRPIPHTGRWGLWPITTSLRVP
jgi:hypothetical protein